MRILIFALGVELFSILSYLNYAESILIETKQGYVRGQIELSRRGRQFHAFYGIPYAEPPIGELRLEPPLFSKKWNGILNATRLPSPCLNQRGETVSGQEDCLYLNVYTPKVDETSLLPVMVFVHGGNHHYGNALPSRYGPHYFMDKDVVLITFHYRLGPLGFLSTEDEIMPGNYGLKDFVEVLRWVQRNIESFGGDKARVTIAGGSSGGQIVGFALTSPLTKGLFHRCISQSGFPKAMEEPGFYKRNSLKFASLTSCRHENISSSAQLKSCLKNLSIEEIGSNIEKLYTLGTVAPMQPYSPVVENEKIPGAFLIDHPLKLLDGNINVPWLLGINSAEGGMMSIFTHFSTNPHIRVSNELEKNYLKYFPEIFIPKKTDNVESVNQKTKAIVERYFGDTQIGKNYSAWSQVFTSLFAAWMRDSVNLYKGLKYIYYFDHRGEQSFDKVYGNPTNIDFGVIHGDELISMFNWSESIKPVTKGIDLVVSEQMIEFWVNFATYGNPNGKGEEIWHPMKKKNFQFLHIKGGELKMRTELFESDYEFWKHIWS